MLMPVAPCVVLMLERPVNQEAESRMGKSTGMDVISAALESRAAVHKHAALDV